MTIDAELMALECRLRLIEHIDANPAPAEPLDLWVEGFWAGIEATSLPRTQTELEHLIEMRQTAHARNQESLHANHRPRSVTPAPIGRAGDAAAAELSAYLAETYGAERDRDGR